MNEIFFSLNYHFICLQFSNLALMSTSPITCNMYNVHTWFFVRCHKINVPGIAQYVQLSKCLEVGNVETPTYHYNKKLLTDL